jgi:hypothetical protein
MSMARPSLAMALSVASIAMLPVWLAAGQPASNAAPPLDRFLSSRFGVKPDEIARIKRGEPLAAPLPSNVDREVAIGGVVHIEGAPERTVDLVRNIERLETGRGFLHTRRLSNPPRVEDFAALRVSAEDLAALRTCRPGRCAVKLGIGAFDLLRRIDWNAPDVAARVDALARQTAFDYIEAYRRGGNGELAMYSDSARPRFVAEEFADMVGQARVLLDALPELTTYLLAFPAQRPEAAEDFFYWSEADFGLKPVVRLNHVVIVPMRRSESTRYALATKLLYANHYFHTALEVRALVDDSERPGQAHYLLVVNMARSDGLTGLFGGLVKSRVRAASRDALEAALRTTKRLAEQASQ